MTVLARPRGSRLAKVAASAAVTAALVLGGNLAASAAEPAPVIELTADQEADLRAWWTAASVPAENQDALILNLEAGVLPQSSTNATPVSTLHDTTGGMERTIYVYADGSRKILSEQIPVASGAVGTLSTISGCTISGTWRVNCLIKIEDAFSGASFRIDWLPSSSGSAQLRDMRAKSCWNSVGSCQTSGSILRAVQSGSAPAWAEQTYIAWIGTVQAATGAFGARALGTQLSSY